MNFLENISPREYQKKILETCIEKNCLVVLPTGLGKTLIALMLTVERMKKFPGEKVVFLAPTRPLAEQHFNYFKKNLSELFGDMQLFTGEVKAEKRKEIWQTADIIFSTPQCVANDLQKYLYDLSDVCLLIEDEAHRCVKNYGYTYVAKKYKEQSKNARLLGLTASPGSETSKIKEICNHLAIEGVEVRTRESPDVKDYLQELEYEKKIVELPEWIESIRKPLHSMLNAYIDELRNRGALYARPTKTELINLQKKLMMKISRGDKDFNTLLAMSACAQTLKLQHAAELLETQTVSGFNSYMKDLIQKARKGESKGLQKLVGKHEFNFAFAKSTDLIEKNLEHPKIEEIQEIIKKEIAENPSAKIIVFSQYRSTVAIIADQSNKIEGIRAKTFVGQAKKGNSEDNTATTGISQKEQQKIIGEFSSGEINLIACTSIGEEGLDIPEVSTIIFYEPVPSAVRSIQRRGRTARLKPGKVIMLITKDTKDESYYYTSVQKEKKMYKAIDQVSRDFKNTANTTTTYKQAKLGI